MKKITNMILAIVSMLVFSAVPIVATHAIGFDQAKEITKQESCKNVKNCDEGDALASVIVNVTNIILFLVGAVAVIMLIIGGLRYVSSNGDQNAVTGAKNTILYAIIGIIVAFLAYAAVQFVVGSLTGTSTKGSAINSSIHKTAVV
ncbi:MAG: hypothetical protein Q7T74_07535 [Candidatus Saccharibacteria bacterium]|nr:hypothetical protein [Candidatus Saccharibacteria bacterium]